MTVGVETPNALMAVFSDTVTAGFASLQGAVNGVFGLMIVLVVALTGIQWVLSPNREILAAAFGKILMIGAFAWLINDWQALSETIYDGFIEIGLLAGGGGILLTASGTLAGSIRPAMAQGTPARKGSSGGTGRRTGRRARRSSGPGWPARRRRRVRRRR